MAINVSQMDQAAGQGNTGGNSYGGLGASKFNEMDQVATGGGNNAPSSPPDSPLNDVASGASSVLRGLGLGIIPNAVSAVSEIPDELGAVFGGQQAKDKYMSDTASNPFTDPRIAQGLKDKNAQEISSGVTGASQDTSQGFTNAMMLAPGAEGAIGLVKGGAKVGGALLKGGVKGAVATGKNIGAIAQYPSKTLATNAATTAARAATPASETTWDDLSYQIRKEAENQLGSGPDVTEAVSNLLSEKTPPAIESLGTGSTINGTAGATKSGITMSQPDLLQWRRQLANKGVYGDQSITGKVGNIARRVISNEIHSQAPGTITPDRAYSIFSKIGHDAPSAIKNAIVYGLLAKVGMQGLGGLLGGGGQ